VGDTERIEEYLAALPDEYRAALSALRETIRRADPDATEAISYQMPAFKHNGRSLVGYAAFKDHCSLFPMSTRVLGRLSDELGPFRSGKGTLRFHPDRPLPPQLVTKIIEARIEEITERDGESRRRAG
jgi:uncharacterized protein YdhG (YjbR/CyaY superfamily)